MIYKFSVLFIGSAIISEKILNKLIQKKINIVGIVGKKRIKNSDSVDLRKIAIKNRINFTYSKNINSIKTVSWIKKLKPDYIFCIGWNQLLNEKILKIPKETVGYHPSLLPYNRGRHPIIWAIFLGLKKTGSTYFFMNKIADGGKIISQKSIKIKNTDNSTNLYKKIISISTKQVSEILKKIQNKKIKKKQNIIKKKHNYWRKRNDFDGKIDWRMNAQSINKLVKALSYPYPNSYFIFKNKKIEIKDAKIINIKNNIKNIEPGKIFKIFKNGLIIKTYDQFIYIKTFKKIDYIKDRYLKN